MSNDTPRRIAMPPNFGTNEEAMTFLAESMPGWVHEIRAGHHMITNPRGPWIKGLGDSKTEAVRTAWVSFQVDNRECPSSALAADDGCGCEYCAEGRR